MDTTFWKFFLILVIFIVCYRNFGDSFPKVLTITSAVFSCLIVAIQLSSPAKNPNRGNFMYRMLIKAAAFFGPPPRPKSNWEIAEDLLVTAVKILACLTTLHKCAIAFSDK
ncbi:uncharacterized protein LOC124338355 [Daphnia pulicaria]|uniref:uncharacterized protein LOC124338355 n=1 Tax=Daphnia pulicaria TaxID=35523 RepID=UPI001EE9ED9B|nr:uncharacterized protein LOC124338355 [Daphnia pulicaria]